MRYLQHDHTPQRDHFRTPLIYSSHDPSGHQKRSQEIMVPHMFVLVDVIPARRFWVKQAHTALVKAMR